MAIFVAFYMFNSIAAKSRFSKSRLCLIWQIDILCFTGLVNWQCGWFKIIVPAWFALKNEQNRGFCDLETGRVIKGPIKENWLVIAWFENYLSLTPLTLRTQMMAKSLQGWCFAVIINSKYFERPPFKYLLTVGS